MKKTIIFLLLILYFYAPNIKANTCDVKEVNRLTELASRIKINYEVEKIWVDNLAAEESGIEKLYEDNFYLTIYNLTEDLFIIATNNKNDEKISIDYSLVKEGKYSLNTRNNLYNIAEYTFKVYAQNEKCKYKELKTIKYTKPIRNYLYSLDICQKNLDIPVCEQYTTKDLSINPNDLEEYIKNYRKNYSINTTTHKNNNITSKNNYIYIGIGIFIITIVGITLYIINKKRREL